MNLNEQYDDKYALIKIHEGNEDFFNLVFERYRNRLFAYLFKITKSREASEEIVLDVFLKLWHGREIILEIENLERFLFKVAYNKAIDFLRSIKRNPLLQEELFEKMDAVSDENADKKVLRDNIANVINVATEQLSEQRKKVFHLRHTEGLSYSEIAQKLNLSSNTVRNHLAASIQFIREIIAKSDLLLFCFLLLGKKI